MGVDSNGGDFPRPGMRSLSSGMWLGAVHATVDLAGLARGWLVGREFGPLLFGNYQTMLLANQLASAASNVNEYKYLSQVGRDEIDDLIDKIFSVHLVRCVLTACIVFVTAPLVVFSTASGVDIEPFLLLSLIPLIGGLGSPGVAIAARNGRYWRVAFVQLAGQLITLGAAALLLLGSLSLYTGAGILISMQLANVIASYLIAPRRPRWKWDPRFASTLLAFGLPLLIDGLLFTGIRWGEIATISRFAGLESVGFWGVVVMMARNPFFVLMRVWSGILLPKLADEAQATSNGESLFFRTIWVGFGINVLGFLGTLALVEVLLVPLFGIAYEPGRDFIIPAAAIASAFTFRAMISLRVLVLGKTKSLMLATLVTVLGLLGFSAASILGVEIKTALWSLFFGELLGSVVWLRLFSVRGARTLLLYLIAFGVTILVLGTFVGPEISTFLYDAIPFGRG